MSFSFRRRSWTCAVALLALAAAAACRPDAEVLRAVPSPDRARVARYYTLSGGGGAGYVGEYVDVRPRGEPFDPFGRRYALGMGHAGGLTLAWAGPRALTVTHPGWADVFRQCPRVAGVRLTYVPRAAPDSAWGEWARIEYENHRALPAVPRRHPSAQGCA